MTSVIPTEPADQPTTSPYVTLNELIDVLNTLIRADDTFVDQIIRNRHLHPEVRALITAGVDVSNVDGNLPFLDNEDDQTFEGNVYAQNLSGINTGDAAIGDGDITYAKIQNVSATDKILGRSTSGAGVVEEITCTSAGRALIDDVNAAAQRTTLGLDTMATQAASAVAITGGAITNTTIDGVSIKSYVDGLVVGLLDFKGSTNASGNPNYPSALKGDAYYVSVAGKVGGASGKSVDIGDVYIASADNAGGTEASVGTSWFVLEHNLVGALVSSNNLSDVANTTTARSNLGLGTLATQSGTFSGTSSGTNTGDQTSFYSGITNGSLIAITTTVTATINRQHYITGTSADYTITLPSASSNNGSVIGFIVAPNASASKQYTLDATGSIKINTRTQLLVLTHGNCIMLVSNGTDWLPLVWNLNSPWVDAGVTTITGLSVNPTKGTTVFDHIYWRRVDGTMEVRYSYRQTAIGVIGTGDYLLALPIGATSETLTTTASISDGDAFAYAVGTAAGTTDVASANGAMVPYDTTHIRIYYFSGHWWGSGYLPMDRSLLAFHATGFLRMTNW